jgi:hypothetical protein
VIGQPLDQPVDPEEELNAAVATGKLGPVMAALKRQGVTFPHHKARLARIRLEIDQRKTPRKDA